MPSSRYEHISDVISIISHIGYQSFLDVGCGFGRWGFLAREFGDIYHGRYQKKDWLVKVDAVEIHRDYLGPQHEYLYDKIHLGKVEDLLGSLPSYDVIFAGDVLEHLEKDAAIKVIKGLFARADKALLVAIPLGKGWGQGELLDNPHEEHKAEWNSRDLKKAGACFVKEYYLPSGHRYGLAVWQRLGLKVLPAFRIQNKIKCKLGVRK
jgi:SAM-dependent methyltransferase